MQRESVESVSHELSWREQFSNDSNPVVTPISTSPELSENTEQPERSDDSNHSNESVKESSEEENGDHKDNSNSVDPWGLTELPEYVDTRTPLQITQDEVKENWVRRSETSRYERVIVLLISWEEHDLPGLDADQKQFQTTFECLYKYDVWRFKIPMKKPHLALTKKLMDLARADSPETLFIIWYDGHGNEHEDQRGCPRWSSHFEAKMSSTVDSSIISIALADSEADILLINNACSSLTCGRFRGEGIVECISASAFNTSTYGSHKPDDLSLSMSWAALRILRDRKSVEEGISVTELHRQICLAVQWTGGEHPDYDEVNPESQVFWKPRDIRSQPVYTRLSADAVGAHGRTRGIVLRQLKPTMGSFGDYIHQPDLQIQLKVTSVDEMDSKQWSDWLLSAPPDVLVIRLEGLSCEDDNDVAETQSRDDSW
ncbi:hypothetical protein F5B22DRAFT_111793 [Xylaria bambusicola]|uniref:uncharacterized protein n=1 Tax=Xylaria bambusicola TaxID=326684 RepID=UPI002007B68F|nr:uncharacterized protein F5B22DRAFT_111793 [Xylaria bambusicola]KAI0517625.1 hypothetical protein F5B22DRAFT_111793 [Xylaria bambusicola]